MPICSMASRVSVRMMWRRVSVASVLSARTIPRATVSACWKSVPSPWPSRAAVDVGEEYVESVAAHSGGVAQFKPDVAVEI